MKLLTNTPTNKHQREIVSRTRVCNWLPDEVVLLWSAAPLSPAAFKLSSIFMQMNISFRVCRFSALRAALTRVQQKSAVEEPQMEKLHVGLCRNSQRSWHTASRPCASCSLSRDDSQSPLMYISLYIKHVSPDTNHQFHCGDTEGACRCNITVLQRFSSSSPSSINRSIPPLNLQSICCWKSIVCSTLN